MQYNCGAFELVLDQSKPLVKAGVLMLVGDFTSLVQLISQYIHTLLHSLSTEHRLKSQHLLRYTQTVCITVHC